MFTSSTGYSPGTRVASTGTASPACRKVELHGPAVVVTIADEADGTAPDGAGYYVYRFMPRGSVFMVNVTDIAFLGAQGLRALAALGRECGTTGVDWAAGTSHSVIRLLRALRRRDALAAVAQALRAVEHP